MFFILNGIFILLSYLTVALMLTVIIIKTAVKPQLDVSDEIITTSGSSTGVLITTKSPINNLSQPDAEIITDKLKIQSPSETSETSERNFLINPVDPNQLNINYVVVNANNEELVLNIKNPNSNDLEFMDVEFSKVLNEPYFEIETNTNMIINKLKNGFILYLTYNNQLKKFELSRDTSIIKLSKNSNIIYLINDPSKMLIYKNNLVEIAPNYNSYLKRIEIDGKFTLKWYDDLTNTYQLIAINTYTSFDYEANGSLYKLFIYDNTNKKNYLKITDTIMLTPVSTDATVFIYDIASSGLLVFNNQKTLKKNYLIYDRINNTINITDIDYMQEAVRVIDKNDFEYV